MLLLSFVSTLKSQMVGCGEYHRDTTGWAQHLSQSRFPENFYMDRFGNKFTYEEMQMPATENVECNCGDINTNYFHLVFEDCLFHTTVGFDDPIEGPDRRNALCRVFKYISDVIVQNPGSCGVTDIVNIRIQPSGAWSQDAYSGPLNQLPLMPAGYAGLGINYVLNDRQYRFSDVLSWIVINTGVSPVPLMGPYMYHGALRFNFQNLGTNPDNGQTLSFHLDENTPLGTNEIDFFHVALHEALHMLGIGTFITQLSSGMWGSIQTNTINGNFSRWDKFLQKAAGNVPLINCNGPYNCLVNSALNLPTDVTGSCEAGNVDIVFHEPTGNTYPIYTGSSFNSASTLSHLAGYCNGVDANYTIDGAGVIIGDPDPPRTYHSHELKILKALGYRINTTDGNDGVTVTDNDCSLGGVDDFKAGCDGPILEMEACPGASLVIHYNDIVENDVNVESIQAVQLITNAYGSISLTSGGQPDITLYPVPGVPRIYTIRYIPVGCNGQEGNISLIHILVHNCLSSCSFVNLSAAQVTNPNIMTPLPNCSSNCVSCGFNNNPCNLICNPEFCSNAPGGNVNVELSNNPPNDWQLPGWETALATPGYYTQNNSLSGIYAHSGHAQLSHSNIPFLKEEGIYTPVSVVKGEKYFFSLFRRAIVTVDYPLSTVNYIVRLASSDTKTHFSSNNYTLADAFPLGYESHSLFVMNDMEFVSSILPVTPAFVRKGTYFDIPETAIDDYTALWINTSQGTHIGSNIFDIDQPELIPDDFTAGESATIQCGSGQSVTLGGRDFCMLSDVKVQYTWTNENTGMVIANYTVVRGINGMETIMDLSTMSILTDIPDFSVSPLVTTTYRLHRELIPDPDGSLGGIAPSELAGIIQDDYVTVTVINELGNPDFTYEAQCNILSFTPVTVASGYSHTWDFGDGSTSSLFNPTHIFTNQGVYTVTHTGSNICGTVTSTQTIHIECTNACNCPEGVNSYTIGVPGSQSNILFEDSGLPTSGISNACITINGNLELNVTGSYTFTSCVFYMHPGSSITITGDPVTFFESTFVGCNKMWRGIIMDPGKTLSLRDCKIYDAQYAITTAEKCHLNLRNNEFIRDYVGIHDPHESDQIDVNMVGNEFQCLNETLLPSFDVLVPPASVHTYAGILIDLLEESSFGVLGMTSNVFHDINNGFVSTLAGYGVFNCRFYNILHKKTNPEYPINGYGIYALGAGKLSLVVEGTGIDPEPPILPSFENCSDGIFTFNLGVDIKENRMLDVDRGITIGLGADHDIGIVNNQIECDQYGIDLYQCDAANDIKISNNYICIDSLSFQNPNTGNGIYLNDAMIPHQAAAISGNYVNLWRKNTGINLQHSNKVNVDNNIIHMNNPNVNRFGVRLDSGSDCNIYCNHVESYASSTSNIGLSVSMTTNTIYENNTFFRNRFGANFTGSCLGTSLITNTFENNRIGLHLATSGLIGRQPANPNDVLNGNIWINTTGQSRATWEEVITQTAADNAIYYNTSIPNTKPDLPTPPQWFDQSTNPTATPDPNECAPYEMIEENISSQDLAIAGDESSTSDIEETMDFIARRYLFRKLDENPELILSNNLLETFWEEASDGTIGKLYNIGKDKATLYALETTLLQQIKDNEVAIKNYLSSIQAVNAGLSENPGSEEIANANSQKEAIFQQLEEIITDQNSLFDQIKDERDAASEEVAINNQVISTNEIFETNEKTVNQIYLETIAKGNAEFTAEQLAQLEYIASQCPLTGGPAVYLARSLLSLFVDDNYDDDSLCSGPISLMVLNNGRNTTDAVVYRERIEPSEDEFTVFALLYPNPANEQVTCRYYTEKGLILSITDIVGNLIWKSELPTGKNIDNISVTDFPAGNYLFTVQDRQGMIIHRESIVVIH